MTDKPVFKGIFQVGLVVRDCMASVKKYSDEYGIGPWAIFEMNPETVDDMIVEGKPGKFAVRAAVANVGSVQIELVEPLDDRGTHAEFLKEHGEGIHHLLFDTDNYDQTLGFFQGKGIGVMQGGTYYGNRFAYLDTTHELGLISAIVGAPSEAVELPQPDALYPPPSE